MTAKAELITIGRAVKPQGRKGEIVVAPLTDRPDRFPALKRVLIEARDGSVREVKVTSCWPHKGRFVLKLEGIDTIEAAEGLRDLSLGIREDELPPLPAGSYYHHQLEGLDVVDGQGRRLGRVSGLMETGATPNLIVHGDCGETLIPLVETFVRHVSLAERRIVVTQPETFGER